MKYYLAGPMSGFPQFNFPLFDRAAAVLRGMGYDIISPAEMDEGDVREAALASEHGDHSDIPATSTWGSLLARDVQIIADEVQGIVFLPHWQRSRGARLEAFVGLLCAHNFKQFIPIDEDGVVFPMSSDEVRRWVL